MPGLPRAVEHIRGLDGDTLYLRTEVADALNVSCSTLGRLAKRSTTWAPTAVVTYGSIGVIAYDMAAVARLHAHVTAHRTTCGRPRLWTDAERRLRRAAYSAVGYRRRRAAELHHRGIHHEADRVEHEANRLLADLRQAHAARAGSARDQRRCRGEVTDSRC